MNTMGAAAADDGVSKQTAASAAAKKAARRKYTMYAAGQLLLRPMTSERGVQSPLVSRWSIA